MRIREGVKGRRHDHVKHTGTTKLDQPADYITLSLRKQKTAPRYKRKNPRQEDANA